MPPARQKTLPSLGLGHQRSQHSLPALPITGFARARKQASSLLLNAGARHLRRADRREVFTSSRIFGAQSSP
jgi:hypothetical protein